MSRAFKASRIAWASRIPEDWQEARIVSLARLESGHTPSRQHDEYWVPSECTIPWFGLADVWQLRDLRNTRVSETSEKISPRGVANSAARLLPRGTVILSRTASVGFSGILDVPMATTQDFANFVCGPRLLPEYLLHALRAMRSDFDRLMMGSTHRTIYMPDIRKLSTPVPPLDEQRAIADFLDEKTAAIDDLIAKKERLLVLLDEQRQALITRAVTQGLDPSVPMKATGIYWATVVPAHWTVPALGMRWHVQLGKMLNPDARKGVDSRPYLRNQDVQWDSINTDGLPLMDFDANDRKRFSLLSRDVLVCEGRHVGKSAVWEGELSDCYYQKALHRLRALHRGENPYYLVRLLEVAAKAGAFDVKDGTTIPHLPADKFRAFRFPFPAPEEQDAIMRYLTPLLDHHRVFATRVEASLEKLRECRSAVVTAAVTGQLDVLSKQARTMEPAA